MTLIIVSQSGVVSHALESSALNYFESVKSVSRIQDISDLSVNTRAILYDFTITKNDIEALLNFEMRYPDGLKKVVLIAHESLNFRDLESLIGKVGAILPHTVYAEDIILFAHCLRSGIITIPAELLQSLTADSQSQKDLKPPQSLDLTPRQRAVLAMLAEGQSNKLIARYLGINDTTVRVHVRAVLRKLGVSNRTQAALVAKRYLNA